MIKLMTEHDGIVNVQTFKYYNLCWLFIVCSQIFCHCSLIRTIENSLSKCTFDRSLGCTVCFFLFFFRVFFPFLLFWKLKIQRFLPSIHSNLFVDYRCIYTTTI